MCEHKTIKGRPVDHTHFDTDLHAADQEIAKIYMRDLFPNVSVVKEATLRYNCHGFALAPEHPGWFNFPDFFLTDNYTGTPKENPQVGDVLIYSKNALISHSAVVVRVRGGEIERLQSKWGGAAEVLHAVKDVPDVYGEPVALLRPLPGRKPHPAAVDAEKAAGPEDGAVEEAAPDTAPVTAGQPAEVPERFLLMLASTPEVRRRILESHKSARASEVKSLGAPLNDENTDGGEEAGGPDDIGEALKRLSDPRVQFGLMLASSPDVLRLAAAAQEPVETLIRIGKTNPEAGRAVLELFEKAGTQADEQITGLTLYLLAQLPLKEAVGPIARYLSAGKFSSFNGGLAVDALSAAVAKSNGP